MTGFSFKLSDEQKILQDTIREFAFTKLFPSALSRDLTHTFAKNEITELAEMGILGMTTPEQYSGSNLDPISETIVIEELAKCDAAVAVAVAVHTGLAVNAIKLYGTEAQKEKYLPLLALGTSLGAYSLSESACGSDAAALSCAAIKADGNYIINGSKLWVTNGKNASIYILFARTNSEVKQHMGISAFIIEAGIPGFTLGKIENKMGMNSSDTVELNFVNCVISQDQLLGSEGDGFKIAMSLLDASRIGIGAQALGIAQGAFDFAVRYSLERSAFGQPISKFQSISNYVSEMAVRLDAARLLIYRAAWLREQKLPFSLESSMAKYYATETAGYVTDRAVQILGGYGYSQEFPVERYFREAKLTQLYEGTNEIQRIVIAREILKKYSI